MGEDGHGRSRIVTRFKSNTPLTVIAELAVPKDGIGLRPQRQANLMHRKRIDRLIGADPKPRSDPDQMVLQWP